MNSTFETPSAGPSGGSGRKLLWIVLGSLLVLFVLCIGTCVVFRDDFTRAAISYGAKDFRRAVEADSSLVLVYPTFGALTDQFVIRVQSDSLKQEPNAQLDFVTVLQSVHTDQKIDTSDVKAMAAGMIAFFPDLAQYWNPEPVTSTMDSTTTPADSSVHQMDTGSTSGQ